MGHQSVLNDYFRLNMIKLLSITLALLFYYTNYAYAQTNSLHLQCEKGTSTAYRMHEASRTHCFDNNKALKIELKLLDEMIYHITLCTNDKANDFEIPLNISTEKIFLQYDSIQKELIVKKKWMKVYDNSNQYSNPTIEFQSADNQMGLIEIRPPLSAENACVGILIQYRVDEEE